MNLQVPLDQIFLFFSDYIHKRNLFLDYTTLGTNKDDNILFKENLVLSNEISPFGLDF